MPVEIATRRSDLPNGASAIGAAVLGRSQEISRWVDRYPCGRSNPILGNRARGVDNLGAEIVDIVVASIGGALPDNSCGGLEIAVCSAARGGTVHISGPVEGDFA